MSQAATEQEQQTERPERAVLIRTFDTEITAGDGRTVDLRVVPYDIPATVSDGGPTYQEEWAAGCFDDQLRAANRVDVLLNFEHERGIGGLVGRGISLRSQPDGLHASFHIFKGEKGDIALELVNERILSGASLEAYSKKAVRTASGVVRRVKAHLDKVALCRRPAFKDAVVLAVREEVILDEALLPLDMNPSLVERCRSLGLALPERYRLERAVAMPTGMDSMPDGVTACTMNDTPGFKGDQTCHTHNGTDGSMRAAMRRAEEDARSTSG